MTKFYKSSSSGSLGTTPSEVTLIWYSQQGDRDAFASLYDTYCYGIRRYILIRVADPELAEDITSLVFLRAWENLNTFRIGQSPFGAWLRRIAHNAVIDLYRTRKPVVSLEEIAPLQLSYADEIDKKLDLQSLAQELVQGLKVLTGTQQEVLILRFILGLTTPEIARSLNKQEGAIRALQMRGFKRLAQYPAILRERALDS
jgi:RNA polymerase sigma-70 factor, ECF subfamily